MSNDIINITSYFIFYFWRKKSFYWYAFPS